MYNEKIDNIIADTKEDFKEKKARLSKQSIQHWDVAQLGFLKHVTPDIDVPNLCEYLANTITKLHKIPLKIGLKVKTPWDGKKRVKGETISYRDQIQAVHIECEGSIK